LTESGESAQTDNRPPEPPAVQGSPPGWRRRLDSVIARITGNIVVQRVMAVVGAANHAGATLFSAALAFSTMFAFVPLLLLLSGVVGWLVDDPAERSALLAQLVGYFPPLASLFEASIEAAVRQRGALSIVGLVGLLWGASTFYSSLDEVMRRLFPGGGSRGVLSRRARGIATILILVGLILGTVSLGGVWALLDQLVGGLEVWRYIVPAIALAVMVAVVFAVYRLVPTRPPGWRAALPPAIVAGIAIGLLTNLFSLLAPLLLAGLSGFGVIATVFGALVWLNFSYQVLLYGAAWARLRRDRAALAGETRSPS
jgi:membrane protein